VNQGSDCPSFWPSCSVVHRPAATSRQARGLPLVRAACHGAKRLGC
jgi:hypothetical protein